MQMKASQIYARDNVQSIARRYGSGLTQGLTIEDIQAWPDILQNVTEEQILAAADSVLNIDRSVTGYLLPPRAEPASSEQTSNATEEVSQ